MDARAMAMKTVQVGTRAPEFDLPCTNLPSAERRQVTLADYDDRWLLLIFYPRDFSMI
jgi:peroxiredoxin